MKAILLLFSILGFCGNINAQETISSKELIGTWTYLGPNKLSLNDTIILTKDQKNAKTISQWTFKMQNSEIEMFVRIMGEGDSIKGIDVKSNGVKWALKYPDCLIIKNAGIDKCLKVLEKSEEKIVLVRIK
jgi:hypothetical protein